MRNMQKKRILSRRKTYLMQKTLVRDDMKKRCDNCTDFITFLQSKIPFAIVIDNYEIRCRYCKKYLGTYGELIEALDKDTQ